MITRSRAAAVRLATSADSKAIAQVHVSSWRAAYKAILPDAYLEGLSVDQRARSWRDFTATQAQDSRMALFVAERAHELVGFAAVGPLRSRDSEPHQGELYALYLDPGCWGKGIGSSLHDAALTHLRNVGYAHVAAWVLVGNQQGRAFYERHGWHLTPGRLSKQRNGVDFIEIRYERPTLDERPPLDASRAAPSAAGR